MRNVLALCAPAVLSLALIAVAGPAGAASPSLPDVQKPDALQPGAKLDKLFADLKRERNEQAAERISRRIWEAWNQSGSANVDLMMQWAQKAIEDKKFDVALDFLDQVTTMKPDYAEGWNRRATVHFMMNNFSKSMVDIERTLELEPRHFGALSGMAQIMRNRDRKELALAAYERILAIYPMMRSAQAEVAALSEELAGEGI
jgi:tetratricopeptide (TPR) repeat protein